jgi:uncharacterized protein YdeI (YjbR/CyaY-like superfamily)
MHDVLIPKPSMSTNTNQIRCQSLEDWRSWLSRAMEHKTGVWLVYPKKQADPFAEQAAPALTLEEAVQEALCWGWIDSKPGKVDDRWSKLWFAPRRQGSAWSAKNKAMVVMLEAEGRMQAPGRAAVEIAKANGMWTFLDDVEAGVLPDDSLLHLRNTLRPSAILMPFQKA